MEVKRYEVWINPKRPKKTAGWMKRGTLYGRVKTPRCTTASQTTSAPRPGSSRLLTLISRRAKTMPTLNPPFS